MTCSFHLTSLSLARQTDRESNRPKPPTHPSVPLFKLSLNEPSHLSSPLRQLTRIKSQKNLDKFAWKHDSCQKVLRRRDSVTRKLIHAKKDWIADTKRKFLEIKREEKLIRLDKDYVEERKREFQEQQQAEEEEDGDEKLSRPPKQMWKLPRQVKALSDIRAYAFQHEKRRLDLLSNQDLQNTADDQQFWDYEKNLRSPLYDYFRGAQVLEDCSVSDTRYSRWSVAQLPRRIFGRLVNPANPGEPVLTIRKQAKAIQFSMRNIKVTVNERRKAIGMRQEFLLKYQLRRSEKVESHQWLIEFKIQKSKIQNQANHHLKDLPAIENYLRSTKEGQDFIYNGLRRRGLSQFLLDQNMPTFDKLINNSPKLTTSDDKSSENLLSSSQIALNPSIPDLSTSSTGLLNHPSASK
ncbi:hypothetical protein PSTG_02014 [Puccinia striiformis f. sp. tritici PST-78]|uniref:Uncharacterized protein n=2 Tax=Puccinia striiformis f. sp. tritici TaxID=168172 RepID=A0A0L0W144_9BASI|nr:hypothetical protein PSTG_02014 [Puccinia striiformis f. sp. tritici PST-78]